MESDSLPFVSIVTPVYNAEEYLPECIESVLNQTYQNWEYVIINNCSSDKSLRIIKNYAQQEIRIRICDNKKFLNRIQNLNHAMRMIASNSKYCKVVHADDWIFPECVARMVEIAEAHPSVGIVGSYRLDENLVNLDGLPYPTEFFFGNEICRYQLLGGKYIFGSPTSILIRSDIIRRKEIFYNEINIHSDQEVCFEILQNADFGFVHQILTFTRRHNETATTFSKRFNTYILGHFITLTKFGPQFLSHEEYNSRLKIRTKNYYKFLAKGILELREIEFYKFHFNELKRIGHPIKPIKLLMTTFFEALNLIITIKKLKSGIKKRFDFKKDD
jgi:glycosyltransferase involved in cell wall biosynthesis